MIRLDDYMDEAINEEKQEMDYSAALKKIKSKLKDLSGVLSKHEGKFKKDKENWEYVGDLNLLSTQLDDILKRLKK